MGLGIMMTAMSMTQLLMAEQLQCMQILSVAAAMASTSKAPARREAEAEVETETEAVAAPAANAAAVGAEAARTGAGDEESAVAAEAGAAAETEIETVGLVGAAAITATVTKVAAQADQAPRSDAMVLLLAQPLARAQLRTGAAPTAPPRIAHTASLAFAADDGNRSLVQAQAEAQLHRLPGYLEPRAARLLERSSRRRSSRCKPIGQLLTTVLPLALAQAQLPVLLEALAVP